MNRQFNDWLNNPSFEESVCKNPFHETVKKVFEGHQENPFDPYAPDESHIYTKIAKLLMNDLILLEGDVVYVREGDKLHPLNEATNLLAYYMHTDSREARKAADVIESNFMGYFPVVNGKVWRNGIRLDFEDGTSKYIDLQTLDEVATPEGYPEFGTHLVKQDHFMPLVEYFSLINGAVGDPWFFEKTLMYPFNQRIREKSHVLVGGGGNGKSLFMLMVQRLFGGKAFTDAPQPNFKGHDPAVISYGFIGKRVVTFNDVGDPSTAFLEWLKRMITGNLEVKTPSGAWLSIPSNTNFLLETNHPPQILDLPAHKRRYVVRYFDPSFLLAEKMSEADLDIIGERGSITAGDIVSYLCQIKSAVTDWVNFDEHEAPQAKNEIGSDF